MQCPVEYLARVHFQATAPLEVRQFGGQHAHTDQVQGHGGVFNIEQSAVAKRYAASRVEKCTLVGLKDAFRVAGIAAAALPSKAQMQSWVGRENVKLRNQRGQPPSSQTHPSPVALMEATFASWKIEELADVERIGDKLQLLVLPGARMRSARADGKGGEGYIPFTCKGMVEILNDVPASEPFVLGVDAKVGKGPAAWRTASIGLFFKGDCSRSTLKRNREGHIQGLAFTTSFHPIVQSRMHQETNPNFVALFLHFIAVVALVLKISSADAAARIVSVAKDFNAAIEHGRFECVPNARPVGDSVHFFANMGLQLPRKCKQEDHEGQINHALRAVFDNAATADLFDAMLEMYLHYVEHHLHEDAVPTYLLSEKYVEEIPREQLLQWHVPLRSSTKASFLFASAWQGLYSGVYPGTASGNQATEAFHRAWERWSLGMGAEDRVAESLSTMQHLYREDGAFSRLWAPERPHGLRIKPKTNPELIAGDNLRRCDLSPAVDYWQQRSECQNYVVVEVGTTTVAAFSNHKVGDKPPAEVAIDVALAQAGARMLFEGGETLSHSLFQAGVFELQPDETAEVRISAWNAIFVNIAYALRPPHPASWHEYPMPVCTCRIWGQQQACQHLYFADGLALPGFTAELAEDRLDFGPGPRARKQGRPQGRPT